MTKGKQMQMQIPTKAFIDLYKLTTALDDYNLDYETKELVKSLKTTIESKLEAMAKRQAFTEYKTAEKSTEDRETKRKRYLELAGTRQSLTSKEEISL